MRLFKHVLVEAPYSLEIAKWTDVSLAAYFTLPMQVHYHKTIETNAVHLNSSEEYSSCQTSV
jgi:hypothetical protein